MITEPEIEGGPMAGGAADVLSGGERVPRPGGGLGARPWVWALGGIAAACAVWTAVLQGTGYGRTPAPGLHGYHLAGAICTTADLQPFADAVGAEQFTADPGVTHKGPTLDHTACTLSAVSSAGNGWTTTYTATVTVDLHKKADPRVEFEDAARTLDLTHALASQGVYVPAPGPAVTRAVPGLGDRAYSTTSATRQAVRVLDGGAVLSLSFDAVNQWQGTGTPVPTDGGLVRPALADTASLRPALVPTMRRLMRALTSP